MITQILSERGVYALGFEPETPMVYSTRPLGHVLWHNRGALVSDVNPVPDSNLISTGSAATFSTSLVIPTSNIRAKSSLWRWSKRNKDARSACNQLRAYVYIDSSINKINT